MTDEKPPKDVYDKIWNSILPSNHKLSPTNEWKHWQEALLFLADVAADYPKNQDVLHKRMNAFDYALKFLGKETNIADNTTRVELALEAIACVPKRFKKNSPFGAACISTWEIAHYIVAKHHPDRTKEWDVCLKQFMAVAQAATNAPRSYAEANLLSAKTHNNLMKVGTEMPWYSLAFNIN